MSDIIEEVSLDHTEERKLMYFKKALPWVIGATFLVIIGMMIYNYRAEKRIVHNQEMGDMLIKAISLSSNEGKTAEEAISHLIKESSSGIGDIAMLEKAALYLNSSNREAALSEYEKIAKDARNNLTRSYAKIVWMSIIVDQIKISDHEREIMEANIKSFVNENTEFFGTAQVLGAFFRVKNNQVDEAKSLLQKAIAGVKVPQLVKDQAKALLANLSVQ